MQGGSQTRMPIGALSLLESQSHLESLRGISGLQSPDTISESEINPLFANWHPCHVKFHFPKQESFTPRKSFTLSALKSKGEIQSIPHTGLIFL